MRGSIKYDEKTKTWYVVFDIGIDPATGSRKQKKKRGFKKKKEAETFLTEQVNSVTKGTFFESSNMTIKEYLEYWLEHVKAQVAPKTYLNYRDTCQNHLIPYFHSYKLPQLQPIHAQKFFTELGTTGLANSTITSIHRIFKTALNQAVKWELISKNIMASVDKPRTAKSAMQALDSEQTLQLLDATENGQYHAIILTALYTGMRRGELLGLTWKDVDFEKGVIRVRQTAQRIIGQGIVFDQPKTSGSRRTITISQEVVSVLKKEKARQAEWQLRLQQAYSDKGLVFSTKKGEPVDPKNLQMFLKRNLKAANLPSIRFHDLRHTHATLLLQQGVHPKIVSERLGHSGVSMTLDTYSHVLPNMQQEAIQKFDEALKRKIK